MAAFLYTEILYYHHTCIHDLQVVPKIKIGDYEFNWNLNMNPTVRDTINSLDLIMNHSVAKVQMKVTNSLVKNKQIF